MAKLPRVTAKIFASNAADGDIGQYGSALAGKKLTTSDISEIQALPAYEIGWRGAVVSSRNYPTLQEMNGLQKTFSQQIAYNFQEGIPEYDAGTDYYIGSIVKVIADGKPVLYSSLTDNNIGNNPTTSSENWEELSFGGGGLEIGDIGFTQMAIDESKGKRRILNGQLIIQDQYVQFTNIVKNSIALNPDLACTEEEWQTVITMSEGGICYKFVVDDEAGTIRLPKYPNYFIGGVNDIAPVVGNGVLGMTYNGSTTCPVSDIVTNTDRLVMDGGSYDSAVIGAAHTATSPSLPYSSGTYVGISTDPTKSGIEAEINQEKIIGTYFIQVATGAETEDNIINEIELNNPFSLLDYKFSEYELSNISWLRSNGQYNSKAIYPAVYDLLLKIYNGTETKAGVSVKLATETFTDYDFVLNTTEETFRLPVSVNNSAQGYLYFYVGETVQNANLINAGRIEEKLSGKLDKSAVKAYIIETYVNGTSWYRLWSDNWCEQGGIITVSTNVYKGQEVTLLKAYKDTNYHINAKNSIVTNDAGVQSLSVNAIAANANPLTNSTFAVALYAACKSCRWTTSGYIA